MKRFLAALLVAITCLHITALQILAAESAVLFSSDITINQNTSLSIKETIQFQTSEEKHGIYRYIPRRYEVDGLNYQTKISRISVTDEKGRNYQVDQTMSGDNLTLKIGDPDQTFSGRKTYVITYQVDDALKRYADHDELYWDITGEGWNFPIEKTIATIHSDQAQINRVACYSGDFGGDNQLCTHSFTDKSATFTYPQSITYGQNMTVVVGLAQPNQLIFPTPLQKLGRNLRDNVVILVMLIPGAVMGSWWWRKGRDRLFVSPNVFDLDPNQPQTVLLPWSRPRIPFVYEPIKDITPGEAGAMLDESADDADVIAEIIDLARQKYLKIERTEKKKLFGKDIDYLFTQLKAVDGKVTPVQKYLYDSLFKSSKTVKLSSLKGTFYTHMAKAKEMLYAALTDKKMFVTNPKQSKDQALIVAFILSFGGLFILFQLLEKGLYLAIPLLIISVAVAFVSALKMPAKTALGSNIAMQAHGLKQTISRGKWREEIKEKQLFIETIFPFALAFGVVDKLTRDMEALKLEPPPYMTSSIAQGVAFNSFVTNFTSQATSSMSYNPNSSSSSGGSGFSGGSSGGGGGGGGGGSW